METGEAAVLAALCVILVSIPAASQKVEVTEEGYRGFIDSDFSDRFDVDFQPGKVLMEMLDSERSLEVNQSYRKDTVKLQTSKGFLRKVKSSNSINTTVQTPYGRLESGVVNGENFSRFDGGNREKAEEIKEELEEELEESMKSAKDKKRAVVKKIMPNVVLEVNPVHETEHFNITNKGDEPISIDGWQVVAEGSGEDSITVDGKLEPGEKRVFVGSAGEVDFADEDTGLTIYSDSGTVTLFNSDERIVDSFEY